MIERRRVRWLKGIALILGLTALGVLIIRWTGQLSPSSYPIANASPPAEGESFESGGASPNSRAAPDISEQGIDLTGTPPGPTTPADGWANAVLDLVLPLIQQPPLPTDGLTWWQGSGTSGVLALMGSQVTLGGQPADLSTVTAIEVVVPNQTNPNRLDHVASIQLIDSTLSLSVASLEAPHTTLYWRISNAQPALALEALINQARLRDLALNAALVQYPGGQAQLALAGAYPLNVTPTPRPATPAPAASPSVPPSATPTRVPEPYLGTVLAAKIDPVIDSALLFSPQLTAKAIGDHPMAGFLTWTETGAQINGRPTAVIRASRLNFYVLDADDPTGSSVTRFLTAVYVDNTTRLPDEQVYFQGQRMEEMLYWIVRHAAERGGQLLVVYDDFGATQALTVIGFQPFAAPGN